MQFVLRALAWHRHQLVTRPYVTNAVTSGCLMVVGDRLAQRIEEGHGKVLSPRESRTRTGVLTAWSSCVSAPFWTWWYIFLDRILPGRVLTWVALTAVVPAPAWNFLFFTVGTALEHVCLEEVDPLGAESLSTLRTKVEEKVSTHFLPTVVRSASVWIPVNLVNFHLVPRDYRTTMGASVGLLWNVYMSLIQHSEGEGAGKGKDGEGATAQGAAQAE